MSESVASPVATSRVEELFARAKAENRIALLPFVTIGYPTLAQSREWVRALVEAGADGLELGVPFSDPLADGATVQRTSQIALEQGVTLADAIELVRQLRTEDGIDVPLLLMGYTNPFYQYGLERLAADAQAVGIDGFIVPDLPVEEAEEWTSVLRPAGRDLIFFVAPTSTEKRLEDVATHASGFIYCVSLTGVTGAREALADDLSAYIGRVRAKTDLPLVIGFGISTPQHVAEVAGIADGAIVASALINYLDTLPESEQAAGAIAFTRELKAATGKPS
jgi:tryptophan synthase alpha chain